MPLPFSGAAQPLSNVDVARAATLLGCAPAAVRAVCMVETGSAGGFLSDGSGRPRILFEAAKFSGFTSHQYDASHPLISVRVNAWSLYRGGAAEYDRLAQAVALDRPAALRSASWGLFQIMGFNCASVGYRDVEAFVTAMADSEGNQLLAFVRFCQANRMEHFLRDLDWAGFARAYNGPLYAQNKYDTKLAAAYALAVSREAPGGPVPGFADGLLRMGSSGAPVQRLQVRLAELGFASGVPDGLFGPATELALRRYQAMRGLEPDGVAGLRTRDLLFAQTRSGKGDAG